MIKIVAFVLSGLVFVNVAAADTLYGTILHKDGSKVAKTVRITTSFNGKVASYPADGQYILDFQAPVGRVIKVYLDGDTYTSLFVKGNTRLDIRLKK